MKTCPFCKEEIKEDAIKCKYCQSILVDLDQNFQNSKTITYVVDKGLLRFGKFVSAALALFIAAGLILYGYDLAKMADELDDAARMVRSTQVQIAVALANADEAAKKAGEAARRADEITKKVQGLQEDVVSLAGPVDKPGLPETGGPKPPMKTVNLRATPKTKLTETEIYEEVHNFGFSLPGQDIYGNFQHSYELIDKDGSGNQVIVVDHATGLMWQQSGSPDAMTYPDALKYVDELNIKRFAGHPGWRLPTIEELISLVEPIQKNGNLYIDKIFNDRQQWIRSIDKKSYNNSYGIVFYQGSLYFPTLNFRYYVRAVRSASS